MHQDTKSIIVSIIDVIRSMYQIQESALSRKLKNIDYIHIDTLISKIEKEIPPEDIPHCTEKIVSIIESIIED